MSPPPPHSVGGTRTLTIMSTDLVSSTATTVALSRADFDQFRVRNDQIIPAVIASASGEIFKSLGDGYLASFESSTNAVLAGLRIQDQLRSLISTQHLDDRFTIRIGISSGDVAIDAGDRFGVPVILATRVQSIAPPGSVYMTESVALTMNRNEASQKDLGYISLKGFDEKMRVFEALPKGVHPASEDCAVLCTDIRAFTGDIDDDVPQWQQVLALYDSIVFRRGLEHKGFFRYNVGDAYWITFAAARDALDAAIAMTKDLRPILASSFIFAIHFGPVKSVRGRLYGSTVSRVPPSLLSKNRSAVSRAFYDKLIEEDPIKGSQLVIAERGEVALRGSVRAIEHLAIEIP